MEALMSKEHLLPDDSEEDKASWPPYSQRKYHSAVIRCMCLVITCLLASNIFLLFQYRKYPSNQYGTRSKFAGLSYDTPMVYHNHTDYMSSDPRIADNLWNNIDTSPMVVALTDDWASQHSLPRSVFRFPWDEDFKGIYFLKVYHGLHCLKAMRKAFIDYERGLPPKIAPEHVYHCFDALRQDLLCTADDTPMPMTDLPNKVGDGQVRMCRNFDRLIEWSHQPERDACYRRWSDYKSVKNKIEMFAFCREDSRYYELQQAYFEKWGHKDPYEDGGSDATVAY